MELLTDEQRALFVSGGRLDDYDVLKPIGKGKFSVVYKASRGGQSVALKKISIFDLMDARAREKTLKEVRLVQSVSHPHIIQYVDAFLDQKELYIAFEWAEAGDLKRQIRKANEKRVRFDERTIWRYFTQLCAAILHLHRARIMHRDLKPANIFLTLQGEVKVGDLGLGRHLSENTLEAHSKVGTPLYMSPEVLRGEGYDWKSDVWSLGCILYELAMMRSPFKSEGLNLYGLFQKISKGDYEPVSSVYSEHLRRLVTRMTSLSASERPTMEEVWNACQTRPSTATLTERTEKKTRVATPEKQQVEKEAEPKLSRRSPPKTSEDPATISSPAADDEDARSQRLAEATMETLYERLKLLRCDTVLSTRLSRQHFASESRYLPTTYASSFERFKDMMRVAKRLLELTGASADDLARLADDQAPLTLVQTLLVIAERHGVSNIGHLSAPSLTSGVGLDVCTLLDALSQQALEVSGLCRTLPQYPVERVETVDGEDAMEADGEESEDGSNDSTMSTPFEDDTTGMDARWLVVRECLAKEEDGEDNGGVLYSHVDAAAWRREVERMSRVLTERWRHAQRARPAERSWHTRLETIQLHADAVVSNHTETVTQLQLLREKRGQERETMERLETRLQRQYESTQRAFQTLQERLADAQSDANQRQTRVHEGLVHLREVETALSSTSERVQSANAQLTDNAKLLQLKTSLRRLQEENDALSINTEVLRRQVFHQQLTR
ncbi:hypothetical protein Poli38472_012856 [Pythium oligandrum]|uniref:non-specific serine/threonine protein kinase n=1 Tax=Pythium oligandrum TaxID=41045 RepID=A0A8K1CJK0_PYTOL|nr:hypothetical protein Poli38472_012856 [Pythium oligandrum]|eukprot:TMW64234.1 hypothetical protein Poli38472_012856 [Pythium oligandrum]